MARRYDDGHYQDVVSHVADALDARYWVVENNLQYASPGEIQWASTANEASLRASARQPPDRETESGKEINPFWYHSNITE